MVVERELEKNNKTRQEMGRDRFLEEVWKWKEKSGNTIIDQLKRLGASCDWSRNRFTMDPDFHKAVIKVFVDFYNKGLIYKGKKLVNWDPKFQSAISDLEVEQVEVRGKIWELKYFLEQRKQVSVTLASTFSSSSIFLSFVNSTIACRSSKISFNFIEKGNPSASIITFNIPSSPLTIC